MTRVGVPKPEEVTDEAISQLRTIGLASRDRWTSPSDPRTLERLESSILDRARHDSEAD